MPPEIAIFGVNFSIFKRILLNFGQFLSEISHFYWILAILVPFQPKIRPADAKEANISHNSVK
jgi:hypothetical protein